MFRKLIITESEKKQIALLHHILSEDENFASLQGVVYKTLKNKVVVPDVKIKLIKNDNVIKETTSDSNGYYFIDKIELGEYTLEYSYTSSEFPNTINTEPISFYENTKIIKNLYITLETEKKPITIIRDKKLTMIDVKVLDADGKPLGPCTIQIFDKDGTEVTFSPNITDTEGVLKDISLDGNMNINFKTIGEPNPWDASTIITLKATYGDISDQKDYEVTLNNGLGKKVGNQRIYKKNEETEEVIDLLDTNKLTLTLPYKEKLEPNPVPCTVVDVLVVDENNNPLKNVRFKVFFKDKEIATSNFKFIKTNDNGEFNNIMIDSGESFFISSNKNKLQTLEKYYSGCDKKEILKIETKYKRRKKTFTQNICMNNAYLFNDNPDETFRFNTLPNSNKLKIVLGKPTPPEPDYDFNGCTRITRKLYRQMRGIVLGNRKMENLDTNEVVKLRTSVEKCVYKYYKQYEKEKPGFEKKVISSLMNVTPSMKIFELRFTPKQIRDIYGESRSMSLNNTIRKVIFESSEKKNLLKEEKKLIKNRFLFSINDLNLNNRRQFNESKKRLNNETINLIRRGYNQRLVKETLLDVMQSLYGADGTNVITDFKTKLGEKIATQVKNKEEEHNMILSAFNDLPEDMVERAIKENRVDELSSEIATRAMEMYKGQYGTEGLSGLMFASVDENKFKQEVAKLLEPAINDITTKMDEKFKEIQNAVGGITKTA